LSRFAEAKRGEVIENKDNLLPSGVARMTFVRNCRGAWDGSHAIEAWQKENGPLEEQAVVFTG
jgi:hypothetical protein